MWVSFDKFSMAYGHWKDWVYVPDTYPGLAFNTLPDDREVEEVIERAELLRCEHCTPNGEQGATVRLAYLPSLKYFAVDLETGEFVEVTEEGLAWSQCERCGHAYYCGYVGQEPVTEESRLRFYNSVYKAMEPGEVLKEFAEIFSR